MAKPGIVNYGDGPDTVISLYDIITPTMKIFHLTTDAEFEAENLEDAFRKLGEHFTKMADDEDYPIEQQFFIGGKVELQLGAKVKDEVESAKL